MTLIHNFYIRFTSYDVTFSRLYESDNHHVGAEMLHL